MGNATAVPVTLFIGLAVWHRFDLKISRALLAKVAGLKVGH